MSYLDGADLTIYDEEGNNFTIGLSATQLIIAMKVLGIKMRAPETGEYQAYSDNYLNTTVQDFLNQNEIFRNYKPIATKKNLEVKR